MWNKGTVRVLLMVVCCAVAYGIVHDQITARICVEYFSVAHPALIHTNSPTLLGLFWGIMATFWVGIALGIPLALASQCRSSEQAPVPISELFGRVTKLLVIAAIAAVCAGVAGFCLSQNRLVSLPFGLEEVIPQDRHHRFVAVWYAHNASYLIAVCGGIWMIFQIWKARGRPRILTLIPRDAWAFVRLAILFAILAVVMRWVMFSE